MSLERRVSTTTLVSVVCTASFVRLDLQTLCEGLLVRYLPVDESTM